MRFSKIFGVFLKIFDWIIIKHSGCTAVHLGDLSFHIGWGTGWPHL